MPRRKGQISEEWDPNLILRARAAWKKGATEEQCREILGSAFTRQVFRKKAAKHGMKWGKSSLHEGTGRLMEAPMSRL